MRELQSELWDYMGGPVEASCSQEEWQSRLAGAQARTRDGPGSALALG